MSVMTGLGTIVGDASIPTIDKKYDVLVVAHSNYLAHSKIRSCLTKIVVPPSIFFPNLRFIQ